MGLVRTRGAIIGLMIGVVGSTMAVVAPPPAHACSCARPKPTAEHAFDRASAVFAGRAVAILNAGSGGSSTADLPVQVTLLVTEPRKGVSHGMVQVWTHDQPTSCGYPFRFGSSYLVYATRAEDGRLVTSTCLETRPLGDASLSSDQHEGVQPGQPSPFIVLVAILLGLGALGAVWIVIRGPRRHFHG